MPFLVLGFLNLTPCALVSSSASRICSTFLPSFDGSPQSPRAFTAYWADHAEQLGMKDITLHALRHTHASQLIDAGIDVVTISKRLGHANPSVTLRIYAHLFRKRDDKAAAAINAAVAGLVS